MGSLLGLSARRARPVLPVAGSQNVSSLRRQRANRMAEPRLMAVWRRWRTHYEPGEHASPAVVFLIYAREGLCWRLKCQAERVLEILLDFEAAGESSSERKS